MSVEFENRVMRMPSGRVGTARKADSFRVVPSLSCPDSTARKMSRLGGASPHRVLVWEGAKMALIGACSNPENRRQSAPIGVNRSESESSILFCDSASKNPSSWPPSHPVAIQMDWGARSSRSLPVGVPPTGAGYHATCVLVRRRQGSDSFGETPKAADEDVRAPQSNCIVMARGEGGCA